MQQNREAKTRRINATIADLIELTRTEKPKDTPQQRAEKAEERKDKLIEFCLIAAIDRTRTSRRIQRKNEQKREQNARENLLNPADLPGGGGRE